MATPVEKEIAASYLPVAVRAFVPRTGNRTAPSHPSPSRYALVFDTETTVDSSQALLFGSYRRCRRVGEKLVCVEAGLFFADDLPERDPAGLACLHAYARERRAENMAPWADKRLRLMSRSDFVKRVLWRAYKQRALVVGFNLPFDLSRIAVECGNGKGKYLGGFSLTLWDYKDKKTDKRRPRGLYRPRIRIKHIDNKRSFIGFGSPKYHDVEDRNEENSAAFERRFLDLKTLAFALTNASHSLASACRAFEVEHGKQEAQEHGRITKTYIDYNCRDVLATQELLEKLRAEFDRHPIKLDPCKAFSSASIAKAYPRAMNLKTPREQFQNISPQFLGQMMTAYYGGRAECRIRRTVVPVIYCDFLSMYPTVNSLMRLWKLLTAERLEIVEATDEAQRLLDELTPDACFDPAVWQNFVFFASIRPDGDVLPVRARYSETGDAYNIGVNPLTSDTALWYAGPDLCASKLLSGKSPKVLKAYRLLPEGLQKGLHSVRLRGEIQIDPAAQDFFRSLIEERKRIKNRPGIAADERARLDAFLKVLANSGSYGIFAEMNREDLPAKQRETVTVYGLDEPFAAQTAAPEEPGPFCFPPIAALIPAAARLMLALLERCVTDADGSYAFCDTDSMAFVATESGGLVPCLGGPYPGPSIKALSRSEVEAIVGRFAALNPYDPEAVPGSILKIEDENFGDDGRARQLYAYVISAKRYALFNLEPDGNGIIRKYSEHGLGHLLNPTNPDDESGDWIKQLWHFIVHRALGLPAEPPAWLDRPAISRTTASSPENRPPPQSSEQTPPLCPPHQAVQFPARGPYRAVRPSARS
jgi:hypothetical protein